MSGTIAFFLPPPFPGQPATPVFNPDVIEGRKRHFQPPFRIALGGGQDFQAQPDGGGGKAEAGIPIQRAELVIQGRDIGHGQAPFHVHQHGQVALGPLAAATGLQGQGLGPARRGHEPAPLSFRERNRSPRTRDRTA